jgi:hypothetical protein
MLKRSLAPPRVELVVGLHEDLLNDVLHLPVQSRMTTGCGKHPRLVTADKFLETVDLSLSHLGYDFSVG